MALSSYTVNGTAGGMFKTVNNLSWLTVYGAGHEVPYYSGLYQDSYFDFMLTKLTNSSSACPSSFHPDHAEASYFLNISATRIRH